MVRPLCAECGRENGKHDDDCSLSSSNGSLEDARMLANLAARKIKRSDDDYGDPIKTVRDRFKEDE